MLDLTPLVNLFSFSENGVAEIVLDDLSSDIAAHRTDRISENEAKVAIRLLAIVNMHGCTICVAWMCPIVCLHLCRIAGDAWATVSHTKWDIIIHTCVLPPPNTTESHGLRGEWQPGGWGSDSGHLSFFEIDDNDATLTVTCASCVVRVSTIINAWHE